VVIVTGRDSNHKDCHYYYYYYYYYYYPQYVCAMVAGTLSAGLTLTTHLHLVPKLRISGPAPPPPHGSLCNRPYIQRLQQAIAIPTQQHNDRPYQRVQNANLNTNISDCTRTFCTRRYKGLKRQYSYRTDDMAGSRCWFSFIPFPVSAYLLHWRVPE
jgi:hypothetical protein